MFSRSGRALYFSKRVLPYVAEERGDEPDLPVFLHVGVYAYRRAALTAYAALPPSPLERLDGRELRRFLDADLPVAVVVPASAFEDYWELNNPSDVDVLEALLKARGIG